MPHHAWAAPSTSPYPMSTSVGWSHGIIHPSERYHCDESSKIETPSRLSGAMPLHGSRTPNACSGLVDLSHPSLTDTHRHPHTLTETHHTLTFPSHPPLSRGRCTQGRGAPKDRYRLGPEVAEVDVESTCAGMVFAHPRAFEQACEVTRGVGAVHIPARTPAPSARPAHYLGKPLVIALIYEY